MGATLGSDQYNDTKVKIVVDDDVVGVDDDDRRPPCRCQ